MLPPIGYICPCITVWLYAKGMAAITNRSGKWQIRVKHNLLPKPFFSTFDTEPEARAYAGHLETLLDRGIVPVELVEAAPGRGTDPLVGKMLAQYLVEGGVAPTDRPVVECLMAAHPRLRVSGITARWADSWVADMKTKEHLAPGTIRKRVGSLARAIDWYWRRETRAAPPANALRMMPRGYSQYTKEDGEAVEAKHDVSRDRRLQPGEEESVHRALAGEKRPDRERPLPVDPALALMFDLIVNTGMRLKETYRLRVDQLDAVRWVLNVEGTKGERGRIKPRVVPLVKALREPLAAFCKGREGLVFPFWDGTKEDEAKATNRLSQRFRTVFGYAGLEDITEHDLRHEATCSDVMMGFTNTAPPVSGQHKTQRRPPRCNQGQRPARSAAAGSRQGGRGRPCLLHPHSRRSRQAFWSRYLRRRSTCWVRYVTMLRA